MSGPTPRYVAEHYLMPLFLEERGANAVLAAIDAKNADFFAPVWMRAGFRFTPALLYVTQSGYRIGILTFPQPSDIPEAYLGAVVGKTADPSFLRYFLWEEGPFGTVIGEWNGDGHTTYGAGPNFTGNLQSDAWEFAQRVLAVLSA